MFRRAIVQPPSANFATGLSTVDLGKPDYACAVEQHTAYCSALEKCGLTLTRILPGEEFPDSTFVEDTAVLTERCAILARPGAATRSGEVERIALVLKEFYPEPRSIQSPGTLDAGDVCEAGTHFFIGVSHRTNRAGAEQLAEFLESFNYTTALVDIRNIENILHLKSGIGYVGNNRLVIIESLEGHDAFRDYDHVRVNTGEEYAANCVRVNDHVLVAAGYSDFERRLKDKGYDTVALEMSEFRKMDGGLSCLSLRF